MSRALLIQGDARAMPLRAESIDACVCDPPYGIGFMGREWDNFRRSRNAADVGRESVMGRLSRTSPASGSESDMNAFERWTESWAREALRVLKPGAHLIVCGAPRSYHRMACGIEDAGFEIRDCFQWLFAQGFPKSLNLDGAWEGWGTALKPANEPIVIARKPFRGTVKANVERWGTGAINVDGCRVGTSKDVPGSTSKAKPHALAYGRYGIETGDESGHDPNVGRWPPNTLLTHSAACGPACVEGCPVLELDRQSGETVSTIGKPRGAAPGVGWGMTATGAEYSDSGPASRFFPTFRYCPKADRAEREAGTEHLTRRQRDDSRDAEAPGANNPRNRGGQLRGNHHPTVKPVALMRWLVKLITPPGGTVLDCFLGSGTTGVAAMDLGFNFVGIEREAEYLEIARARIVGSAPLFLETAP